MKRLLLCLGASLVIVACSDPTSPSVDRATSPPAAARTPKPRALFARFVSLGTSLSMGVQDAGVFDEAQKAAWPAQLAARVGASYSLPLISDPGCNPPLVAPLALDLALLGAFSAFGSTGDLLGGLSSVCAPLQAGVTLPTNNVAISGADVHDALTLTPELSGRPLESRVLAPGQTQVTAMLSQDPTLVSVELATNEILPASTGRIEALTPYASWESDYDEVIAAVESTGARALLVGLPHHGADFPSVRTSRELFNQWPYLLGLGISVSWTCYFSSNYIFVPGYVLTLLANAPTTATCADVPGAVDYVLTPSDMVTIDARMAQMNARMQSIASTHGWAYFDISVVYDLPKISFDLSKVLFSSDPFGPYMSIDGVHPNDAGQSLLADAAADAIRSAFHVAIK